MNKNIIEDRNSILFWCNLNLDIFKCYVITFLRRKGSLILGSNRKLWYSFILKWTAHLDQKCPSCDSDPQDDRNQRQPFPVILVADNQGQQ